MKNRILVILVGLAVSASGCAKENGSAETKETKSSETQQVQSSGSGEKARDNHSSRRLPTELFPDKNCAVFETQEFSFRTSKAGSTGGTSRMIVQLSNDWTFQLAARAVEVIERSAPGYRETRLVPFETSFSGTWDTSRNSIVLTSGGIEVGQVVFTRDRKWLYVDISSWIDRDALHFPKEVQLFPAMSRECVSQL
jgi:hypothetical protein